MRGSEKERLPRREEVAGSIPAASTGLLTEVVTFHETVMVRLLHESRTDTFARMITADVVAACRDRMDVINEKGALRLYLAKPWPDGTKTSGRQPLKIVLNVAVKRHEKDAVSLTGSWNPTHETLSIFVTVTSPTGTMRPQHLAAVQSRAYNAVRHELEHALQDPVAVRAAAPLGRIDWNDEDSIRAYFLSPVEVEAYVAGMYHAAKRERVPFVSYVDRLIKRLLGVARQSGARTSDVLRTMERIRQRWLEYAARRFPRAQIRY